jgi:8-oxo-dGTP diphosphatase
MSKIEVVAGIIFKKDKILIARRKVGKSLAGKWEFPGGKIEDETPQQALQRELIEEMGLRICEIEYVATNSHKYPDFEIILHAYRCQTNGQPQKLTDHDKISWATIEELSKYDFAEADKPIIKKIEIEE